MELAEMTDERIDGMDVCELEDNLALAMQINCPGAANKPNVSHRVETRLAELGLAERYAEALRRVTCDAPEPLDIPQRYFRMIHASPQDRCRAALRAVRDAKQREQDDGE